MKLRETPERLAYKMAMNCIDKNTSDLYAANKYSFNILEPSAGTGTLIDILSKRLNTWEYEIQNIKCVELNEQKCGVLKNKGYDAVHADFLTCDFKDQKFDIVIAAPPFKNNVDLLHIQKMYSLLNPKSDLRITARPFIVSLTSPYWLTNNDPHQIAFREFLKNKEHTLEMLPDNTFVEKDKTVPTALIKIYFGEKQ